MPKEAHPPAAVIAVAASAGGVEAISTVLGGLSADMDATLLVVLHIAPVFPSVLPSILSRNGKLPASHPRDGEPLRTGTVLVAPPDRHLYVENGRARLSAGPRENRNRPAADPLFRSVATVYGPRSAGVVLSGALDDGTAGLAAIKVKGGLTVVQDSSEAAFPSMPTHAMQVGPDHAAPLHEIPELLEQFVEKVRNMPSEPLLEPDPALDPREESPTALTCPDCGGTLFIDSEQPMRFECRVGHAYSPSSFAMGKQDALESALWAAIVALEERADLNRRILRRLAHLDARTVERYRREIAQIQDRASVLKQVAHEMILPLEPMEAAAETGQAPNGRE